MEIINEEGKVVQKDGGLVGLLEGTLEFMLGAGQLDKVDPDDEVVRAARRKMLREEIKEYFDAEDDNDLREQIDGLLDIIVVAWGSILSKIPAQAAMQIASIVAESNLAKRWPDGEYHKNEWGKVIKHESWKEQHDPGPKIDRILEELNLL